MAHYLKTLPEYFQPVIDGKKQFEIRNATDRIFKVGDNCVLQEYLGYKDIPACPDRFMCSKGWHRDNDEEGDYFELPEECEGKTCDAYRKELYSGREVLIKIKDIFDLAAAGFAGCVAFTFEIIQIRERKRVGGAE